MPEIRNKSEDQKDAEAEVEGFRKDLGPFVVAAEMTRMPMVFTDATEPGNPIIFTNDSFLALTGYGREEVLADTSGSGSGANVMSFSHEAHPAANADRLSTPAASGTSH
jgi:hypothetical protein